jgi:DNA-binding response OmpR family regulator
MGTDKPQSGSDKKRILVVDDHEDNVEVLRARLEARGYDVQGAMSGQEALDTVKGWCPDLILLDVMMPDMDGLEVVRRLKADRELPFIPVIMQTALDSTERIVAGLEAGADDYVTKPSSPENLRARLEIAKRRIAQDEARRTAESELARSRWLAGIGETTIALEHEINNPLSALLGHAELLMMDRSLSADHQEQLLIIQEQAARIAQVVRRLAKLKNPQSVEYLAGSLMLDLSSRPGRTE